MQAQALAHNDQVTYAATVKQMANIDVENLTYAAIAIDNAGFKKALEEVVELDNQTVALLNRRLAILSSDEVQERLDAVYALRRAAGLLHVEAEGYWSALT